MITVCGTFHTCYINSVCMSAVDYTLQLKYISIEDAKDAKDAFKSNANGTMEHTKIRIIIEFKGNSNRFAHSKRIIHSNYLHFGVV